MKNYLILGGWLSGKNQLINKLLSGKEYQSTHYLRYSYKSKAPVSVTEYFSCDVHIMEQDSLELSELKLDGYEIFFCVSCCDTTAFLCCGKICYGEDINSLILNNVKSSLEHHIAELKKNYKLTVALTGIFGQEKKLIASIVNECKNAEVDYIII